MRMHNRNVYGKIANSFVTHAIGIEKIYLTSGISPAFKDTPNESTR